MATILDGKNTAEEIKKELKLTLSKIPGNPITIAFILVGCHPPSLSYVKMKKRSCEDLGILSIVTQLEENITEDHLLQTLEKCNLDPKIDGILVQQPLPPHINSQKIMSAVIPTKDIDGFHPLNLGKLVLSDPSGFIPCTPLGILTLLKRYQLDLSGREVLILGRSNIVGRPLSILLSQNAPFCNATVTLAHSKTQKIEHLIKEADVLISAMGAPHFIRGDMIKKGAIVIDVGINRVNGKIVGDVEFTSASLKASYITPVPFGIGPMTIAMLLSNAIKSR